jgi:hypothetical protein
MLFMNDGSKCGPIDLLEEGVCVGDVWWKLGQIPLSLYYIVKHGKASSIASDCCFCQLQDLFHHMTVFITDFLHVITGVTRSDARCANSLRRQLFKQDLSSTAARHVASGTIRLLCEKVQGARCAELDGGEATPPPASSRPAHAEDG